MEIETKRIALGDEVILGSDGFLEMTTDEQIYEALKERNLEQLNQKLQDAKNMDDLQLYLHLSVKKSDEEEKNDRNQAEII